MQKLEQAPAKKEWVVPQLTNYGSVEKITENTTVNKTTGTGDSILVQVPGQPPTVIDIPGQETVSVSF